MILKFSDDNFNSITTALYELEEVDAVALGGSRATGAGDEGSDYDVYVYCCKQLSADRRRAALSKYCSQTEFGNHYWESEDNCVMQNGICIDIIYRDVKDFEQYIDTVIKDGKPFNGYTTCFWYNIITSKVVFDKSGCFTRLREDCTVPYPEKLRTNIIDNNRKLLSGRLPSYDKQIQKAYRRGDLVSVHHRITGFLESYFDIIFALNRLPHPGEKRLIELCKQSCKILPEDFEENINALLASVTTADPCKIIESMVKNLDAIIKHSQRKSNPVVQYP